MSNDEVELIIDELRQYKQAGGRVPPATIDRIIGLLGQQKTRIGQLTATLANVRAGIVGIVADFGPNK
jgi:hypothetical protein